MISLWLRLWSVKEAAYRRVGSHAGRALYWLALFWCVLLGVGLVEAFRIRASLDRSQRPWVAGTVLCVSLGLGLVVFVAGGLRVPLRRIRSLSLLGRSAHALWRHMQPATRLLTLVAAAEAAVLFVFGVTFPQDFDGAPERIGSQFVLNNHGATRVVTETAYWRAVNGGWGAGIGFMGGGFVFFVIGFLALAAPRGDASVTRAVSDEYVAGRRACERAR